MSLVLAGFAGLADMPTRLHPGPGRPRKPRAQPKGADWRDIRARVLDLYGPVCYLCGHEVIGVPDIDHVVPVAPGDARAYLDLANLRPAHGAKSRCLICGKCCNQVKGRRVPKPQQPARPKPSRDW